MQVSNCYCQDSNHHEVVVGREPKLSLTYFDSFLTCILGYLNSYSCSCSFIPLPVMPKLLIRWNRDFSNLLWKRKLVRKIEGGMKSRFVYKVLFLTTRKANRNTMALLYSSLAFIWMVTLNDFTRLDQKLESPCTHDKQHQQESQA